MAFVPGFKKQVEDTSASIYEEGLHRLALLAVEHGDEHGLPKEEIRDLVHMIGYGATDPCDEVAS